MRRAIIALAAAAAFAPVTSAEADTSRSCSQPFEGSPCLENVVCGAVGTVVQRAEPYGVDPSFFNCIH